MLNRAHSSATIGAARRIVASEMALLRPLSSSWRLI
jgi:hypothetical protein